MRAILVEALAEYIAAVNPANAREFEKLLSGFVLANIGAVRDDGRFLVKKNDEGIISSDVKRLECIYKARFKDF